MMQVEEMKWVGILQENILNEYVKFNGVELHERCFTKNGGGEDERHQYRCPNAGCTQIVLAKRPFGSSDFRVRQMGSHNCQENNKQKQPRLIKENFLPIYAQLDGLELHERSYKVNKEGGGEDEKRKYRCPNAGCPRIMVARSAAGSIDYQIQQKGEHNCHQKREEEQQPRGISPILVEMQNETVGKNMLANMDRMELYNGQEDENEEEEEEVAAVNVLTAERGPALQNQKKKCSSPCTHCGKRFSTETYLRKHLKLHTKIGLYRCNVCNKKFLYPSALRKHMAIHANKKPFQCNIYGKSFKDPSARNRHKKSVH